MVNPRSTDMKKKLGRLRLLFSLLANKLVKDLRNAVRIFGLDTVTTDFFMCNIGLKELQKPIF